MVLAKRQLLARQVKDRDCDPALYLNGSKVGQESFVLDGRAMGQIRAMQPRTAAGAGAAHPALELADTSGSLCQPGFLFHFIWPQNTHQNGNGAPWTYVSRWGGACR